MSALLEQLLPCRQLASLELALAGFADLRQGPALAAQIRVLARALATAGGDGLLLTRVLSGLNDALTIRVIELVAQQHRLPAVNWCWLALGSEGRGEQTFVTDQDNGLVFSAANDQEAAALRTLFLPFAQAVNARLADCGFELCSGGIMAGNPVWCLSYDEWREQFIDWVRRPDPAALLNASIFFDLRPLYGDAELAEKLRSLLLSQTVDTSSFLYLMAANALQAPPPLSFRGEVLAEGGVAGDELDLKKFGSRIFVDAARIFALASGCRAVSSVARLRQAGPAAGLLPDELASSEAALNQILRLRLRQQMLDAEAGLPATHGLRPATLNEVDQAILRESLLQARRLQQRLKLNYSL
ncbi:MAG: DUF294 nucleotidyltransferase-like domain-containing protein [Azonexus sp.]